MSLHGTSESLGFSELLEILAERSKTGLLRLYHQGVDVQIYLDNGQLCDTSTLGDGHEPVPPGAPSPWLTQTCCELLQWTHFTFDFEPAAKITRSVAAKAPVLSVLASAKAELAEWEAIESVIPSLESRVRPIAELTNPDEVVILDSQQWRLMMAMNGSRTVEGLIRTVGGTRLETCRQLRQLIDRGLVELVPQPAQPTTRIDTAPIDTGSGPRPSFSPADEATSASEPDRHTRPA